MYQARGNRVGFVTNDQAQDLVDTKTFRAQGLATEEVPGACFCCRFDDLVADALLSAVLVRFAAACGALGGEVAHLKLIGMNDAGAFAVGNVVSSDTAAKLSLPSGVKPKEADLIVNARAALDLALLEAEVRRAVMEEASKVGVSVEFRTSQSLRPGRPVPTHRYPAAKG